MNYMDCIQKQISYTYMFFCDTLYMNTLSKFLMNHAFSQGLCPLFCNVIFLEYNQTYTVNMLQFHWELSQFRNFDEKH